MSGLIPPDATFEEAWAHIHGPKGWHRETCGSCSGHGVVSDYGNGEDFYGPKECKYCIGIGFIWITPKGRIAAYPGGPFLGRI